ncbi:hypothetical protein PG993_002146 [Apiospora rasikravindrae]|uniref:Uncharacterized protein n=1 Tax=Apiospora rasikravindrae TaxID=990691 RepID=A0ABR1UDF6_9PEZI
MSNNGAALELSSTRSASPRRPGHRMSRSITDASAPTKQRHGHQHHHLPHLHHRRSQRDRNDRVPQSAAPTLQMPARASLDITRSEGVTPYVLSSAEQSHRASMVLQRNEDIGTLATAAAAVKEKQLRMERDRAASRTAGLKKSITDLNTFSTDTMRRLDDTYYAVLEKLSTLQSTLVAMKELACMSQETNEVFKKDSQELVTEVETQLDSFGQFDEQEERIEALKGRILTGRQKVQSLSERMDRVHRRVENWERADKDWQERTRKRLRVVWIITSIMLFVVIGVFLTAQYGPSVDVPALSEIVSDSIPDVVADFVSGKQGENMSVPGGIANTTRASDHLEEEVRAALNRTRHEGSPADEAVLRAFDEL